MLPANQEYKTGQSGTDNASVNQLHPMQ